MSFPQTVDEFIDLLDRTFPEVAIGPEDTMDKIKFDAGQRSVVAWAKQRRATAALSYLDPQPPRRRGEGRRVSRKASQDQRGRER